jgi:plasmid stabilization system protein ParE
MPKRRRKLGRPRTGHDPMVGVRLPAARLKQIGKIAAALSCDRSGATKEEGVRIMPVVRYPFLIFYAVSNRTDEVVILRIRHAARQRPWEQERE